MANAEFFQMMQLFPNWISEEYCQFVFNDNWACSFKACLAKNEVEPDVAKIAVTFWIFDLRDKETVSKKHEKTFSICYHCFQTWESVQTDISNNSQTNWLANFLAGSKQLAELSNWNSQACIFESPPCMNISWHFQQAFQIFYVTALMFQN